MNRNKLLQYGSVILLGLGICLYVFSYLHFRITHQIIHHESYDCMTSRHWIRATYPEGPSVFAAVALRTDSNEDVVREMKKGCTQKHSVTSI